MKVVIADPKTGKSYQTEIDEAKAKAFLGMKIGNEFDGALVGLTGYSMKITGGSDKEGFPMRYDVHGADRKRLLLSSGPGLVKTLKGERRKKTVRGNMMSEAINQMNITVLKAGEKSVAESLGIVEKPAEEKKEGA